MLQTLLAFFGYIKVPKEAIQMSMCLEDDFKDLIAFMVRIKQPGFAEHLKVRKKAMRMMTKFLRTGRLLQ